MEWPEDISNDLRAPRPDEPTTLRGDILDELADHLQSSLEHEQIRGNDEQTARTSVLSKFGNPATIACQLWWNAMWGKIMIQRITLGFVALLCACSIFGAYSILQTMYASQTLTMGLIAEVRELSEQVKSSPNDEQMKYLEWIPVTVKLEYENGEPVMDETFEASLEGTSLFGQSEKSVTLKRYSDSAGTVDFGFVRPGAMSLKVKTPWNEFLGRTLVASPGNPLELTVTCPSHSAPVDVNPKIKWPEELQKERLWTYLNLRGLPRTVGQEVWYLDPSVSRNLLIDPDGISYWVHGEILDPKRSGWNEMRIYPSGVFSPPQKNYGDFWISPSPLEFNQVYMTPIQVPLHTEFTLVSLPAQGVKVDKAWFLKHEETDVDADMFRIILPISMRQNTIEDSVVTFDVDSWTCEPSDLLLDLVHKRLEQIDELEAEQTLNKETESANPQ